MAQAPRPGVGRRSENEMRDRRTLTVTIRGESHTVAPGNIPLRDSAAVRKATGGLSPRMFLDGDTFDVDSLKVLWWLGRRIDGEPDLTLDELEESWPTDLEPDDIDIETNDGTGDAADIEGEPDPE